MTTANPTTPQPPPIPRRKLLVPSLLAVVSTLAAFASHARFGAPGDHPVPLLVLGCVMAFVAGAAWQRAPIVIGFAALSGFAIEAAIDLVRNGGHNLLPFEFAIYLGYGVLGVLAARLGGAVGVRMRRATT